MKGYTSLKQVIDDFGLYKTACSVELGRSSGRTITSLLKKRIDHKLRHSSASFKATLSKRGFTKNDIALIAAHDLSYRIYELSEFLKDCFMKNYISQQDYTKLLKSNALKSGRLPKLTSFLPRKLESKQDLLAFIKSRRGVKIDELNAILSHFCGKKGYIWAQQLLYDQKAHSDNGVVYA